MNNELRDIVRNALEEDIKTGDITTEAVIPRELKSISTIIVKENCIVSGLNVAEEIFRQLDGSIKFRYLKKDGEKAVRGDVIAEVMGDARAMLTGERTALNFLQRMTGIATKTGRMVEIARGGGTKILDTRKTTPGLRVLEKYAVRCGGGTNHRMGLYDQVLIKDNHIQVAGITYAVARAKKTGKRIEVEATNIDQVKEALKAGADIIMLDNMKTGEMKKAVSLIGKKAITEISGGVDEKRLKELVEIGADWISVGALTHSVKSVDISMTMRML
ncbi:MAG: carboxylating nicotinate-nucleotide diphosphorylase [Candidatus Aenigmarchaeota archaeon]|nr:carboxylating nicotinate-nucleotide diphosphorylase [Candidatus Aenigmarchaeota archaeon]